MAGDEAQFVLFIAKGRKDEYQGSLGIEFDGRERRIGVGGSFSTAAGEASRRGVRGAAWRKGCRPAEGGLEAVELRTRCMEAARQLGEVNLAAGSSPELGKRGQSLAARRGTLAQSQQRGKWGQGMVRKLGGTPNGGMSGWGNPWWRREQSSDEAGGGRRGLGTYL